MASLLRTQAVSLGRLITENQDLNQKNIKLQQEVDSLRAELKKYKDI